MPEGLSATEVGKEIGEHAKHNEAHERHGHYLSIAEAVLLSIVALMAAWSGYAAAKWSTESRIDLAKASTARLQANLVTGESELLRNYDSATFNTWFTAYAVGNERAMRLAIHRFRPEYRRAFYAWRATKPETNPRAPRGPTSMPQYREPGLVQATRLDARADRYAAEGASAGETSDKYIRVTVFLASVLFLVGISTHFPLRGIRYGLVGLGAALLLIAIVQLTQLPRPRG